MPTAAAAPDARASRFPLATVAEEGFYTGLVGAASVALVFLVRDLLAGQFLATPSQLGTLVFKGQVPADPRAVELPMVIAYNGLHVLLFVLVGWLASFAVTLVERHPQLWYLLAFGVMGLLFSGFILDGALGVPGLGRFHFWAGGVLATGAMSLFLWWRHPQVLRHLKDIWQE